MTEVVRNVCSARGCGGGASSPSVVSSFSLRHHSALSAPRCSLSHHPLSSSSEIFSPPPHFPLAFVLLLLLLPCRHRRQRLRRSNVGCHAQRDAPLELLLRTKASDGESETSHSVQCAGEGRRSRRAADISPFRCTPEQRPGTQPCRCRQQAWAHLPAARQEKAAAPECLPAPDGSVRLCRARLRTSASQLPTACHERKNSNDTPHAVRLSRRTRNGSVGWPRASQRPPHRASVSDWTAKASGAPPCVTRRNPNCPSSPSSAPDPTTASATCGREEKQK